MPDLHDVYAKMTSLPYKMDLAAERTTRIGRIVADEQHKATALIEEPRTRASRRHYTDRCHFWRDAVRWFEGGVASST